MNYEQIPSKEIIEKTAAALTAHGFNAIVVDTKEQAFEKLKELIPQGATIMNGSSTTLREIGFIDYLKAGAHGWNNLNEAVVAEKDPAKQTALRMQAIFAQYFLGSVHAITEDGRTITASASGSQLAPYAFTAPHLIWVASTNKIVPTLEDGLTRIREYIFPLEDTRMKSVGYPGSSLNKILISEREGNPQRITIVLVNEKLGF